MEDATSIPSSPVEGLIEGTRSITMAKSGFKVLIPIFPGFNTLDLNGPLEVLKNSALPDDTFKVYIAAGEELTKSCEGVQVKRDLAIWDIIDPSARRYVDVKLTDFDALIIPGGRRWGIDGVLESGGEGLISLLYKFGCYNIDPKPTWIISICTASEFLAKTGHLDGKPATTHWAAIPNLQETHKKYAISPDAPPIDVQRARFVDAGIVKNETRVVTSGGISCGIDCVLWYVSQVVGLEEAKKVALFMDYPWGFASVDYTQGYKVSTD